MQWLKLLWAGTVTLTVGGASFPKVSTTGTPVVSLPPEAIGPPMKSIGRLAFGANGVLFAADPRARTIYALELKAERTTPGTQAVPAIMQKLAALVGTDTTRLWVNDLAVDPRTRNTYISGIRQEEAGSSSPVLFRVDGAGKIAVVSLEKLKFASVTLPSPPDGTGAPFRSPDGVTHMEFRDGRLYVSGESNEEFGAKFWVLDYPFKEAGPGTSLEIYHGAHNRIETRAPITWFTLYPIKGEWYVVALYECTPLVKFPVSTLTPGAKVRGTTLAELDWGVEEAWDDMMLYQKDGKDYLFIPRSSFGRKFALGAYKIPADQLESAPPIEPGKGEVSEQQRMQIDQLKMSDLGTIQRINRLDETHAVALVQNTGEKPPRSYSMGRQVRDPRFQAGVDLQVIDLP